MYVRLSSIIVLPIAAFGFGFAIGGVYDFAYKHHNFYQQARQDSFTYGFNQGSRITHDILTKSSSETDIISRINRSEIVVYPCKISQIIDPLWKTTTWVEQYDKDSERYGLVSDLDW